MARQSAIEWTHSTWNPVTGCTKVSAGCDHCYAERFSERFRGVASHPFETGFDLTLRPQRIEQPRSWRRPQLIFVNSMSDLFHKEIPVEYISRVFDTMETADWHVYQLLTKRSSPMRDFINRRYRDGAAPSHIWLGVSIENASTLGRLRHLKQTQASVRFVSFEPLLGPLGPVDLSDIHWVIAGGESGPGARRVDVEWLRELRDRCRKQEVAFFFKQWGGRTPKAGGNTLDGRQWLQYPKVGMNSSLQVPIRAAGAPSDNRAAEPMEVGPWVQEKLECLRKYLHAYTTILRKKRFKGYFYIDAFAGPGSLKIRKEQTDDPAQQWLLGISEQASINAVEAAKYISGSPREALARQHPFTDYVFVEVDNNRVQLFRSLKEEFKGPNKRIHIRQQDCNAYLKGLSSRNRGKWHKWRGVVFLDPFDMQVPWNTIAELGKTGAIEAFINFPVGMAIQRLLKRSGDFSESEREKLNHYFGTPEWFKLLYQEEENLFGSNVVKVERAGDVLVRWYRRRLKKVFGYVSSAREIQSSKGRPLYYLIWAGANKTGVGIADHVLQQGARWVR